MIESQNIFDEVEASASKTETAPVESSAKEEETPTGQEGEIEEAPKDLDDKTPLHKDERFKRVIEERNRERQEKHELLARLEALENERRPEPSKSTSAKPAWFAKYFGDDDEAWEGFQSMTASAKAEAKAEAVAELRREQEQSSKEIQRWEKMNNERMDELEEEGERFDRNALTKLLLERPIYDSEGNLDFRTGLELLKLKDPKPSKVAEKRLAGAKATQMPRGSEPKKSDGLTSAEIRKMRAAEGW